MTRFHATARREGRWWVVDVDGVGVTQGRNLTQARSMAIDLIVAMRNLSEDDVTVTLTVDLPGTMAAQVEEAKRRTAEAARAQTAAAAAIREVAVRLHTEAGLTGRDAALVLGVSEQRVSQLAPRRRRSA